MPVDHYENFPVASWLLPARLRHPVAALYAFARSADDFADEGNLAPSERLALLGSYQAELDAIAEGRENHHPVFLQLRPVIEAYDLPLRCFRDLLDAFTQDVTQTRYDSFDELMAYCRRSADPVGRLMLCLFGAHGAAEQAQSDAICSSLQLINHWQDVAVDWGKGRVYLPQQDMARYGVTEAHLAEGRLDARWRDLMAFQVNRARDLMLQGAPLAAALPGRIGLELRAVVAGGLRILQKIEGVGYDVFRRRPVLRGGDWLPILWRAALP